MTQAIENGRTKSNRLSMLRTSVSILTLLSAPGFISAAHAQATVDNGDNATVTSQADGETITVSSGVTSEVTGAPVIVGATNNVVVNNAGTLRTRGVTQTVQFNADTAGSVLNNAATGVLEAESRVVNIDGDDVTVNNSGTILGIGSQRNGTVYANRTANNFSINNIGAASVIDAGAGNDGAGIALEIGGGGNPIAGSITNEGTIQGRGQSTTGGTAGDGLRFFGPGLAPVYDFAGDITNSGTITSEGAASVVSGVRFSNRINFSGTLTNTETGVISGVNNGLYFGDADHADGVVDNAGTISSDSRALNIDGVGLTVNNTGAILGTGNQRNGTVYADSTAQDFTLNNSGTIDAGTGNEGAGFSVELSAEGNDFSIINSGDLIGRGNAAAGLATAGDGIRLERTRVAGALDGSTTGLFTGTITNSGNITSEAANGTAGGIRVVNGVSFQGTLTNETGGVISGIQNGLYFGNPTPAGGGDHTGGVVNNAGTISSGSRALNIDGVGLVINNTGSILGQGNQRNGTVYADSTAQDFTLNNSGTIDAGASNEGAGFSVELSAEGNDFTITNSGDITGRGQASAGAATAGDGLRFERTRVAGALDGTTTGLFTGAIVNSGQIRSEATAGTTGGIRFVNGVSFQGTLTNEADGVIYGTNNGLYFGNATPAGGADHTGGVVNNAGTITSASRALNIDGTGLVVNNLETGRIVGAGNQRNGTVYADGTAQGFTFNNAGLVDAGEGNEGSGFGAEVSAAGNNFTLINSGTIQGRGQASAAAGGAGDGVRVGNVGNIGTVTGEITNSGAIRSEATAGTTAGIRFVNGIGFQGTLTNEAGGVIYGTNNGLYFGNPVSGEGADHTGGVVNNAGTITSASRALNIDGIGLVVNNSGNIVGAGNQRNGTVYADSTAQDFTLNNNGTIDAGASNEGAGFSVELSAEGNDFTITNSGDITGRGQASAGAATAGDGLRFERTRVAGALDGSTTGLFTGTITNSGNITSEATAGTTGGIRFVNGVSFQGTLNNEASGVISGVNNGLYFGNPVPAGGADHTGGVVNNAGTISSDSRALNIDGVGLTVNNTGSILGTGNQRNGTVYFDGTANNVTLNNSGTIDAGAGNNGSGVSIQALAGTRTHTITNSGTIQGRGDALASGAAAGIRAFYPPNMMRPGVDLTIDNSGSIGSETSAGILLENITFTGSITNSGDISGATAAIDTRTSFGNVVINQTAGSLNGDVLTGSGDDMLNITGGALNGNVDLGAGSNLVNITSTSGFVVDAARTIVSDVAIANNINFGLGGGLAVTGDVSLAANTAITLGTGDVTAINFGQNQSLISTTGTLTDAGASLTDNSFLVDFDLVSTASGLSVTPTVANLGAVSSDANINAFGNAFASALAAGGNAAFAANANAVDAFTSNAQFEDAAAALLPSLNNGVLREVYETQNEVLSLIEDRVSPSAPDAKGVWGQLFVRSADRDGEGSATLTGYDATAYGFVLGADTLIGDATRAGVAFSYTDLDIDEAGGARENTSVDGYSLSAYFSYEQGAAFINGAASYSFNNAEAERGGLLGNTIAGEYDVNQFAATLKAGHTRQLDTFEVTPFASLEYATLSQEDFSELGGLNLNVDASGIDLFEAGVGVKLAAPSGKTGLQFRPEVSVAYYYDFIGDQNLINASFAGANAFTLEGVDPSRSSFEVDAALGLFESETVSFNVGYDGEFRSGYSSHGGSARLRFKF
ncbi:autotransporter domain-containing protein [Kordiimonas aquimaris]|uniref:autotransporter domain-containing protein n=1 Tax=Kordiimonas aquimaris TaxID=707591 RepID=UPI0021D19995|nr:autotransporter domain-containing protein [Kordiimonas aquimaris]